MTQKLFILSFNSYKRLGYLHRQLEGFTPTLSLPSYLIIPVFSLPPNLFHHSWSLRHSYRQSFRHLLSVTNSKQKDNILVFNTFPYRHITDMSPTFISDIYIGITATLPPKQYLYRHFTPTLTPTFTPTKLHQPSAFTDQLQIDYFPQIIPKERRRRRRSS